MLLEELRSLISRHARADLSTPIEGVLVGSHAHSGFEHSMSGSVMALIAQGRKRIALGERIYDYRAGQYLIASVDLPVTGQFLDASPDQPALGFGLVLQPAAIAEVLLLEPPGATPPVSGAAPSSMAVSDAGEEMMDAVVRLLRLLDTPRDIPVLAASLKREILWRLILGEQGAAVRQLGLANSHVSNVARAVRWIREHYRSAFRVDDLARHVGMSPSAFYRNFQAVTAMSPIQFQKQIRLQQARLLLAARPKDVASVAFHVGYESASQFSREYRRQFSRTPSEDAVLLSATPQGFAALA
jgi:AraC-like DNA-binding protein